MKKTINLNIRLTKELKETFEKVAEANYTTQSQMLLARMLKEIETNGVYKPSTKVFAPVHNFATLNIRMFPEVKDRFQALVSNSEVTQNQYLVDLIADIVSEFEGVR